MKIFIKENRELSLTTGFSVEKVINQHDNTEVVISPDNAQTESIRIPDNDKLVLKVNR